MRSVPTQRGTGVGPATLIVSRMRSPPGGICAVLGETRERVTSVSTNRKPLGTLKTELETSPTTLLYVVNPLRMSAGFTWAAAGAVARSNGIRMERATGRMKRPPSGDGQRRE